MFIPEPIIEGYTALLQRFIRQRPRLIPPQQANQFRDHLEQWRGGGASSLEDYAFLIRIFITLAQNDPPPTMGELSACLGMPLSSATRIVDWLVHAECVERIDDPGDRRVVRVRLAEKGQQLYAASIVQNRQRIGALLSRFTLQEQRELLRLLNKLLDSLLEEQNLA